MKSIQAFCSYTCSANYKWQNEEISNLLYANLEKAQKEGQKALKNLRENDEEWNKKQKEINIKNLEKANASYKNLWENDKEWRERQRNVLAENGRNNVKFAEEKLLWLYENDPEWAQIMKEISLENIKIAEQAYLNLWNKNLEWRERQRKILAENGRNIPNSTRIKNLKKANECKLQIIKDRISSLNLTISESSININNILKLRKNNICGAYLIRAKYKENNCVYDLLTCKSKYVYDEIYWVLRILSQPEKQNRIIKDDNTWTVAKWWYISNLYTDFEFILLTDENGVPEKEALLFEAKYSIDNNLIIEFDKNHNPLIEYTVHNGKHGYWSI